MNQNQDLASKWHHLEPSHRLHLAERAGMRHVKDWAAMSTPERNGLIAVWGAAAEYRVETHNWMMVNTLSTVYAYNDFKDWAEQFTSLKLVERIGCPDDVDSYSECDPPRLVLGYVGDETVANYTLLRNLFDAYRLGRKHGADSNWPSEPAFNLVPRK